MMATIFFEYGLRRFLDEARTLAQFHHPNIVHVNRYIEANGTAYLIMDYEEGESLEQLLSVRRRLEAWKIQPMLSSVLMGLKSVHDQLYLHRDIKPGNIFLRDAGHLCCSTLVRHARHSKTKGNR
jgi:serine/threonine protein kinase